MEQDIALIDLLLLGLSFIVSCSWLLQWFASTKTALIDILGAGGSLSLCVSLGRKHPSATFVINPAVSTLGKAWCRKSPSFVKLKNCHVSGLASVNTKAKWHSTRLVYSPANSTPYLLRQHAQVHSSDSSAHKTSAHHRHYLPLFTDVNHTGGGLV